MYWTDLLQAAGADDQDRIDYNFSVMAPMYAAAEWQAVAQRQETIDNVIAVSLAYPRQRTLIGGAYTSAFGCALMSPLAGSVDI